MKGYILQVHNCQGYCNKRLFDEVGHSEYDEHLIGGWEVNDLLGYINIKAQKPILSQNK